MINGSVLWFHTHTHTHTNTDDTGDRFTPLTLMWQTLFLPRTPLHDMYSCSKTKNQTSTVPMCVIRIVRKCSVMNQARLYTVPPALCSVLNGSPGMYAVLCTHNIRENFVYIVKMMNGSVLWFYTHTHTHTHTQTPMTQVIVSPPLTLMRQTLFLPRTPLYDMYTCSKTKNQTSTGPMCVVRVFENAL